MFELKKKEWKELVANCDKLPATVKCNPTMPLPNDNLLKFSTPPTGTWANI